MYEIVRNGNMVGGAGKIGNELRATIKKINRGDQIVYAKAALVAAAIRDAERYNDTEAIVALKTKFSRLAKIRVGVSASCVPRATLYNRAANTSHLKDNRFLFWDEDEKRAVVTEIDAFADRIHEVYPKFGMYVIEFVDIFSRHAGLP